ncbi:C4-dicarboxylate-binding protein DctP [Desulfofundulus luciae]|uniref:C4-dicarboxylate-binding protein DctP n=1 Tax=Desulfofundulus luciae TaxID=74702 RepID=A0ABU0AZ54_9FIRM|nr:TRAP transporter substrate-binding protein [Desulfofundulus luciae]MDQ0285754.1 C4-dicarboxylate-binding protein DctP [Desulfofundulus luciae]
MTGRARWILVLAVSFLLITGCDQRGPDGEQVDPKEKIVIKFSHVVAEDTPKGQAARRFARLVQQRTGGRVEVQVFPNSTLYKDGEEMDALQQGAVQMIAPTTSKLSCLAPQWQLLDLPYLFENKEQVYQALDGEIGKKLFATLEPHNIHPLAFWDNGFKHMTNSKRPLVHPRDFAGLTFRVMINSRVLEEQFRCLGARATGLPFSDVYSTLAARQVDGQENTMSNIYSQRFYEVQPYLTVSNHGYMGYVVLTNAAFWRSLPPDIRKIIEETMTEVTLWEREQAASLNEKNFKQIESSGKVKIHTLTPPERIEWQAAFTPLYRQFKPVIGNELVEAVLRMKNYSSSVSRGHATGWLFKQFPESNTGGVRAGKL